MTNIFITLIGLALLSSAAATSEVKAQARANNVVAENWADEQHIANMIMNRVNAVPSVEPSYDPTLSPVVSPSAMPSMSSMPTAVPSMAPSVSSEPTVSPTSSPSISSAPSDVPSSIPSVTPTGVPSTSPTISSMPSETPSFSPSISAQPTSNPSDSPSSTPSETPSQQPTAGPTRNPTSSPSGTPTESPTLAPTFSAAPSLAPTIAHALKKDMYLIDGSSTRTTSLVIIGAAAFIAVASAGVFLYRRASDQHSGGQNDGYGAPIREVSADVDFDDGAGMISPMSRVSGLPRFSHDPKEHKSKKQKLGDDNTDIELGEIPRSVYVSTPTTSAAVSDPAKENRIVHYVPQIIGVQKYFGHAAKAKKPSKEKGVSWNQIRDEGSPACSSGIAPASIPNMFSPGLLENNPSGSSESERNDTLSLVVKKSTSADSQSVAVKKSGCADSDFNKADMFPITESMVEKETVNSASIKKSISCESDNSSKFASIAKTKSSKSGSFFPSSDDEASNDDETAAKSLKSNGTKSVKSNGSSLFGSRSRNSRDSASQKSRLSIKDNMAEIDNVLKNNITPSILNSRGRKSEDSQATFEENMNEINDILESLDKAQPTELYMSQSNESNDDIAMSYSLSGQSPSPTELSAQSSAGPYSNQLTSILETQMPSSEGFVFDADFDNATMQTAGSGGSKTAGSGSRKDNKSPTEVHSGAQLLSPITYQKELQHAETAQEFSFRKLLSDPQNELYECSAPPGPLGIVIDSTPLGPRVKSLNPMSSLFDSMSPGDIIVGIDDIDTVGMEAAEFWQLVSRKANQRRRILTMLKI